MDLCLHLPFVCFCIWSAPDIFVVDIHGAGTFVCICLFCCICVSSTPDIFVVDIHGAGIFVCICLVFVFVFGLLLIYLLLIFMGRDGNEDGLCAWPPMDHLLSLCSSSMF